MWTKCRLCAMWKMLRDNLQLFIATIDLKTPNYFFYTFLGYLYFLKFCCKSNTKLKITEVHATFMQTTLVSAPICCFHYPTVHSSNADSTRYARKQGCYIKQHHTFVFFHLDLLYYFCSEFRSDWFLVVSILLIPEQAIY